MIGPHLGRPISLRHRPRNVTWTAALLTSLLCAGSLRSANSAAPPPGLVKLPEFVVKADLPWKYVEVPGFEVISMASDEATERFIRSLRHDVSLFETMLPEDFRQPPSTNAFVVLHVYEPPPDVYQRRDVRDLGDSEKMVPIPHWTGLARDGYFGATLSDPTDFDTPTFTVNVLWFESNDGKGSRLRLETAVRYLLWVLDCRKPRPPDWLRKGLQVALRGAPVTENSFRLAESGVLDAFATEPRALDLRQILEATGSEVRAQVEIGKQLDLTTVSAAKFVIWGLVNKEYSARFWNFVRRASEENVTEAMFTECFGFGYGAANRRVGSFFPKADTLVHITVPEGRIPKLSDTLALRPARPSELGRIIGEWRRQAAFLEAEPARFTAASEGARISIAKTTPTSPDGRFLAALGISECQAGKTGDALEHLRAAVRAKVVRPRAYLEYARLLFQKDVDGLKDSSAELSEEQTRAIMDVLKTGAAETPALNGIYRLAAEVCTRGGLQAKNADLDLIEQGTRLFPRDSQLAITAIRLHAKCGLNAKAASIANRWLKTVDEKTRKQFEAAGWSGTEETVR